MFKMKYYIAIFLISFQVLTYGQSDEELVLLFEDIPGMYDEIRVERGKEAPKKITRQLKRSGVKLSKLQSLIERSTEQVFLFTNYKENERPSQLGIIMEDVGDGVKVKEVHIEITKEVLKVGDIITGFNGRLIAESSDVYLEMSNYNAGEIVKLTFVRDGEERTEKLKLSQKIYYWIDSKHTIVKVVPFKNISRR